MAAPRILRVHCATWDQVEAFYRRKLRRGKLLTIRLPFSPEQNSAVTLGLELPNQMVVAIDGTVTQVSVVDGTRHAVEINLHGISSEVIDRLGAMVAQGRGRTSGPVKSLADSGSFAAIDDSAVLTPVPAAEGAIELSGPARDLFATFDAEFRRMRELPAHEVLGVAGDVDADQLREAWRRLGQRFHPDVVARHNSPALSHLAEEIMIQIHRAYERVRAPLVAGGHAVAYGAMLQPSRGWLLGFEDVMAGDPRVRLAAPLREDELFGDITAGPQDEAAVPLPQSTPGEVFERQARQMLGAGDHASAREILAAALHVYPRSKNLRALFHVASAMSASETGQAMLATSQLEAALASDPDCKEAQNGLMAMKTTTPAKGFLRRLFQR